MTQTATPLTGWADVTAGNGQTYWYYVRAVGGGAVEGPPSDTVADCAAVVCRRQRSSWITSSVLAIDYFWYEANPVNGLIRDRSQRGSPASIAAIGFGLSAIHVGAERGWIPRVAARDRVLATLADILGGSAGNRGLRNDRVSRFLLPFPQI